MPLSQWEPDLTKNLKHYLMLMYKEVIVQMNINTELKDLSSTHSWLHALVKVYKTLFCNTEISENIINFRGCRSNLHMPNLPFLHCKRSFVNTWVCLKGSLYSAIDSIQTILQLGETHHFHIRTIKLDINTSFWKSLLLSRISTHSLLHLVLYTDDVSLIINMKPEIPKIPWRNSLNL